MYCCCLTGPCDFVGAWLHDRRPGAQVVRMCANFPHHRSVDVLQTCERSMCGRTARWMRSILARPSVVASTPARNSLVTLAPYMLPFFEASVGAETQTAAIDRLLQHSSAHHAEAAWYVM